MECAQANCNREAKIKGLCQSCYINEWQKAKRRELRPDHLVCEQCGAEYQPQRYSLESGRNRFCSRKCKERHRHQQPAFKADQLRRYYKRRYGITPEEADEMRSHGCGICGRLDVPGRWEGNLHIDHDHDTGQVRGVLCHGCNLSLGHLNDPALLEAAIAYLGG